MSKPILLGCEDPSLCSSVLFISLLNYLEQHKDAHIVFIRSQEVHSGFRLRLLETQNRLSPLLKQIHIKYLTTYAELNEFIVSSFLSYRYDLLVIDNWGSFLKDTHIFLKMSRTLALIKELGIPSIIVSNYVTLAKYKDNDNVYSSLFSSVIQIRIVSPSVYSMFTLCPGPGHENTLSFSVTDTCIQLLKE